MISRAVPLLLVQRQLATTICRKKLGTFLIFFLYPNFTFQHHLLTFEPFVNRVGYPEPVSVELVDDIINHLLISWIVD